MSKVKTGGPAFPVPVRDGGTFESWEGANGLTVRDYFAAKAMAAFIAQGQGSDWIAEAAYSLADDMLAARGAQ